MKLDFSQKYAVRPLTAGDVDKILALCAENEQFYRYHKGERFRGSFGAAAGKERGG